MKTLPRLLLAAMSALAVTACGAPPQAEPMTITLDVTDPPAPAERVEVALGAQVRIDITTPTNDVAHLHGYEIEKEIPAGVRTPLEFTASMAGTYELESHVTDAVWLNLVVK